MGEVQITVIEEAEVIIVAEVATTTITTEAAITIVTTIITVEEVEGKTTEEAEVTPTRATITTM